MNVSTNAHQVLICGMTCWMSEYEIRERRWDSRRYCSTKNYEFFFYADCLITYSWMRYEYGRRYSWYSYGSCPAIKTKLIKQLTFRLLRLETLTYSCITCSRLKWIMQFAGNDDDEWRPSTNVVVWVFSLFHPESVDRINSYAQRNEDIN